MDELVKQRGREEPPFLAEELAPLQGIKEIVKTDLGEIDALLIRRQDGYIIKVNANSPATRQNYSCAHESGHTFLHELERGRLSNNEEFRCDESSVSGDTKERLCQIAAAELLMPESVFKKYLASFGVSVSSLERLAEKFKVSIHATAIRIAEVSPEPCIAIKWKPWQKTRSKGFIGFHLRKPIYVRNPSSLLKAYESDSAVNSFKSFEIGGIRKRCLMESKGFGHYKKRHVISLVLPDR
ncbi:MAG: ImmA/IrrE family metallo-endopeptidase [Dehalococcoidia bacterium]